MRLPVLPLLPLLILAACASPPGAGGACGMQRVAVLPLAGAGNVPTVDAEINGQPVRLVLSSGMINAGVTPPAVERLHLPVVSAQEIAAHNHGKPIKATILRLDRLDIGRISFHNFLAAELSQDLTFAGTHPDGRLGIAPLRAFTLDIDMPHDRLSIYRGHACPGQPSPLPGPVVELSMQPVLGDLPAITVMLNGNPHTAVLDTSFPGVYVSARALGLTPPPDAKTLKTAAAEPVLVWKRTFAQLQVGADTLRNVPLLVIDGPATIADIVIGTPYFHAHRIILSMPDRRVFIQVAPTPMNPNLTAQAAPRIAG